MAEMLVDSTKLDACLDAEADAIRAKTGGSADIPFDFANNKGFADAIAAIPTGGGGGVELIADFTATDDVSAINIDFPQNKQNLQCYIVKLLGETSNTEWVYPGLNTDTVSTGGAYFSPAKTYDSFFCISPRNLNAMDGYLIIGQHSEFAINDTTIRNLYLRLYNASSTFKNGFNVKIFGVTV